MIYISRRREVGKQRKSNKQLTNLEVIVSEGESALLFLSLELFEVAVHDVDCEEDAGACKRNKVSQGEREKARV